MGCCKMNLFNAVALLPILLCAFLMFIPAEGATVVNPTVLTTDLKKGLVLWLDAANVTYGMGSTNGLATSWPDLMGKCGPLSFTPGCKRTQGPFGAVSFDGSSCYAYSPGVLALHYTWYGEDYKSPFTLAVMYRLDASHTCANPARLLRMKTQPSRTKWVSDLAWETNSYNYSDSNLVKTPVTLTWDCPPTGVWVFDVVTRSHITGIHTLYRYTAAGKLATFTRTGPSAIVSGDVLNIGPANYAGKTLKGDVAIVLIYNNIMKSSAVQSLASAYQTRFRLLV